MTDPWKHEAALAKAVASAVAADVAASPGLLRAIHAKQVGQAQLRDMMLADLEKGVRNAWGRVEFPHLRAVMKTQMNVEEAKLKGGMSQWAELATAISGAAAGVVGAKYVSDANKDIAKIQANTQLQVANLQANADKLALARIQGFPDASVAAQISSSVGPVLAVGGGLAAAGLIAYLIMRRRG